jgi:hypothetical protein
LAVKRRISAVEMPSCLAGDALHRRAARIRKNPPRHRPDREPLYGILTLDVGSSGFIGIGGWVL